MRSYSPALTRERLRRVSAAIVPPTLKRLHPQIPREIKGCSGLEHFK
jgi:hypothetical protein